MSKPWQEVSFVLTGLDADRAESAFEAAGAVSVTYSDDADQPVLEPKPGEQPLWNHTRITGLFPAEVDIDGAIATLLATLDIPRLPESRLATLDDRDWTREWLKDFKPLKFGKRLWVVPTAFEAPEPGAVNMVLDPGLAFGTGTHPTTALCLEWLDGLDLKGKTVVDYGCGSGILAVAAALLGAEHVHATDIDPQALTATRDNAQRNSVVNRISLCLPDAMPAVKADVVVANILAGPLAELAPALMDHMAGKGKLALAGLLVDQATSVQQAYSPRLSLDVAKEREGWALLTGALDT
ncbi:MAG: 50S ribosomal protein L11 methyltransferase [Gammaproteobacteria bacterium]|nr:50S ribosomal protein L11 methyltransferase [Gammaproteobacteria bacterium]